MSYLQNQYSHDVVTQSCRERTALAALRNLSLELFSRRRQKAYSSPTNRYLDSIGTADTEITSFKRGRIRINGSWWFALSNSNMIIYPGQKVRITDRQGHTLLVELSQYV